MVTNDRRGEKSRAVLAACRRMKGLLSDRANTFRLRVLSPARLSRSSRIQREGRLAETQRPSEIRQVLDVHNAGLPKSCTACTKSRCALARCIHHRADEIAECEHEAATRLEPRARDRPPRHGPAAFGPFRRASRVWFWLDAAGHARRFLHSAI